MFYRQFELSAVLKLVDLSAQDLLTFINRLIEDGFIVPLDAHFKWASKFAHEGILHTMPMRFQFVHDRIQQVAYHDLPLQERRRLHYQIGKLLTENEANMGDYYRLNEIVKHYNYAQVLLTQEES